MQDLDDTIKIIRSTISGLRTGDRGAEDGGLRRRLAASVSAASPALGFMPSLRTDGLVDTDVPAAVADHVVAVAVEALSNTVRHASAGSVDVRLVVADHTLTLTVTDDGVGLPPGGAPP